MDIRRKAFTGHDERFVRLNADATATCDDADKLESIAVD